MMKARNAPTPAASVGVAMPKKMDPSTPSMSIMGGTRDFMTILNSCMLVMAARSSLLMGGPSFGLITQRMPT
jgi:hypothetical protein